MPTCTLKYDNKSKGIYYAGQTITGTAVFVNEKSRKITSMVINFEGFAKSKWRVHKGKNNYVTYRGRQNYVNKIVNLIEIRERGKQMDLANGTLKFPFSFAIPSEFPTSVECCSDSFDSGVRGYVRYLLTVKIERSWKSDFKYEFPLTIIKNFDLNFADLRFLRPVKVEDTKAFTFSSKKLFMSAQTTITAYAGGQKAKFIIHINNESSSDVMSTVIELVRHVNYNSDEPKKKTKQKKECIKTSRYEGAAARSMKEIEAIFTLPSVAPTSDGSCRVLEISYSIKITALLGGLHSDPSLIIPIIIGTVPYFQAAIPIQSAQQAPNLLLNLNTARESVGWNIGASTSSSFLPSATVPTTPEDYDMPPPTYMEATAGRLMEIENEDSTQRVIMEGQQNSQFTFLPSYPVYNFESNENTKM